MTTRNSRAYITTGGVDHPHKHVSLKGVYNSDKKKKKNRKQNLLMNYFVLRKTLSYAL